MPVSSYRLDTTAGVTRTRADLWSKVDQVPAVAASARSHPAFMSESGMTTSWCYRSARYAVHQVRLAWRDGDCGLSGRRIDPFDRDYVRPEIVEVVDSQAWEDLSEVMRGRR